MLISWLWLLLLGFAAADTEILPWSDPKPDTTVPDDENTTLPDLIQACKEQSTTSSISSLCQLIDNVVQTTGETSLPTSPIQDLKNGKRSTPPCSSDEDDDDDDNENDENDPIEKRPVRAFSNWGGKRQSNGFSNWGGKRGSSFSSWGGKRGSSFSSWGGKRAPFSNWGGKRNTAFSSWGGKRAGFSSWGGKRNFVPIFSYKRDDEGPGFNSWGGKRNGQGFSSWGGKRNDEEDENQSTPLYELLNADTAENESTEEVRRKRSILIPADLLLSRYFSRGTDKNCDDISNWPSTKRATIGWSGSRRSIPSQPRTKQQDKSNGIQFFPWGGKR